jgi:hypothetical protein
MDFGSLDDFLQILKSKKKFQNASTILGSKRPTARYCWPGPTVKAARPAHSRAAYRPKASGAVPASSPVAMVENDGHGEHRHRTADMPHKEPRVGAHRGGGTTVGWQRDLGATTVGSEGSSDGCRRCSEVRLRLYESEGEVRAELN